MNLKKAPHAVYSMLNKSPQHQLYAALIEAVGLIDDLEFEELTPALIRVRNLINKHLEKCSTK